VNSESPIPPDAVAQLRHDLRTPVNHIIGYSEILLEGTEETANDSSVADLKKIRSAAGILLELINTRLVAVEPGEGRKPTDAPSAKTDDFKHAEKAFHGRVLAVDDDRGNLDVLSRRLTRHGLEVEAVESGIAALSAMQSAPFDLVLLDVMMPEMDGHEVLRALKSDAKTRDIPVIMISALDEFDSVVRCIEAGAEDYLPKPFNPTLLEARIGACLEKKALRDAEQGHLRQIEETQRRLDKELAEAGAYVRSILPTALEGPLRANWKYRPSSELAGDSFGYHWIDAEHFAIYLLDVCGHGVGACLLSVSAIHVLRSGSLAGVNFRNPGEVLTALNKAFPMEEQNNLYFTLWYGVYHTPSRTLSHASGGHPPALLLKPNGDGTFEPERLSSHGMIVGVVEDTPFATQTCKIPPGSRLFVICDGCYEIRDDACGMGDYQAFETFMLANAAAEDALGALEQRALERQGADKLDDDFSIVEIQFPA